MNEVPGMRVEARSSRGWSQRQPREASRAVTPRRLDSARRLRRCDLRWRAVTRSVAQRTVAGATTSVTRRLDMPPQPSSNGVAHTGPQALHALPLSMTPHAHVFGGVVLRHAGNLRCANRWDTLNSISVTWHYANADEHKSRHRSSGHPSRSGTYRPLRTGQT